MSQDKVFKAIEDLFNIDGVEECSIIVRDSKGGFHEMHFGDMYTLNGMLDYVKRNMFLTMHDKGKKYKYTKELGEK